MAEEVDVDRASEEIADGAEVGPQLIRRGQRTPQRAKTTASATAIAISAYWQWTAEALIRGDRGQADSRFTIS